MTPPDKKHKNKCNYVRISILNTFVKTEKRAERGKALPVLKGI